MELVEIYTNEEIKGWLCWQETCFVIQKHPPSDRTENRETLSRVYTALVREVQKRTSWEEASRFVRLLWITESDPSWPKSLPSIIGQDGFLRMFALGEPLSLDLFRRIWKRYPEPLNEKVIPLNPIRIEWNQAASFYYDEDATPPGVLPKLFINKRLKKDKEQLEHVRHDLVKARDIEDDERRRWLTLALLSHGAAYREIEGQILKIPCFSQADRLIAYRCHKHLIAEGVKTVSLIPLEKNAVPIYLCQGTELWPSQPSMIGSILANFATHGSSTAAYAHSWRRIHKHLRDLYNGHFPVIAGHSMGGSLAMQIGLYSHHLIDKAYAFNPPMPNKRDYDFYHQLEPSRQEKIIVTANLDDFAFWRIGAKIIGKVTLFLGKRRWRYYPVGLWDCLLVLPAFVKFIMNVRHAFPAHQNITFLSENWVSIELTQEEIDRENHERLSRFDYLHFFPKLYDPTKILFRFFRKLFGWSMEEQYLKNEIEIVALHERDLIDTMNEQNKEEILEELEELHRQKERLRKQLFSH